MPFTRTDALIPLGAGNAVDAGWTSVTNFRPVGITWHWAATSSLQVCRDTIGGKNPERKGIASAHYGIGRTFAEGVDRYVSIENRSWHAGIYQLLRWDGAELTDKQYKGVRTTVGIETCTVGFARDPAAHADWIDCAEPDGVHVGKVQPWTDEQLEMCVAVGKEVITRWPNIGFRDHHGHHDLCPTYKQDVSGFPFARVLRAIYDNDRIPDVWSPFWMPASRQQALIDLGYDLGGAGADGDWGPRSDAALRQFQKEAKMVVNGLWTTFVNWKMYDTMVARAIHTVFP